jgi:hypothetical protein
MLTPYSQEGGEGGANYSWDFSGNESTLKSFPQSIETGLLMPAILDWCQEVLAVLISKIRYPQVSKVESHAEWINTEKFPRGQPPPHPPNKN